MPANEARDAYIQNVTIGARKPLNAPIELVEYNPAWPSLYEQEAAKINGALGKKILGLFHVGSTSVPGLCAKPIIDILLVIADAADESAYIPQLSEAGYALRIREPGWHEHRLLKGTQPDINLHVFGKDTPEAERMLRFRDWLRENAEDRELYANKKRELAQQIWKDIQHYADAKTKVVESILERASKTKLTDRHSR